MTKTSPLSKLYLALVFAFLYDAAGNAIHPKGECLFALGFDSGAGFNLSVNCE